MNTSYRKSWPTNLLEVMILTLELYLKVMWVSILKRPYFYLIIDPRASFVETTYRKSWFANLLQMSTLTFDLYFKLKWVIILNRPYIFLIIVSRASKCENNP